jgi:hypothetical protein
MVLGAFVCAYAQLYWPYNEPNRSRTKDHEDQHEGGIVMLEDEEVGGETPTELIQRSSSGISRLEEDWSDPDAIMTVPAARMV